MDCRWTDTGPSDTIKALYSFFSATGLKEEPNLVQENVWKAREAVAANGEMP
jgi:hypothetical protein